MDLSDINKKDERTRIKEPVTRDYLKRAALFYLAKYASSSENLRRVLLRKIDTRLRKFQKDNPDFDLDSTYQQRSYNILVDEVVAQCLNNLLVDDQNYAETKIASLRARGNSSYMIRQKLAVKGVSQDIINQTLNVDDDQKAAERYAKRRKLGPFRTQERSENRMKDLSKMMQAGFSRRDAEAIIDSNVDDYN